MQVAVTRGIIAGVPLGTHRTTDGMIHGTILGMVVGTILGIMDSIVLITIDMDIMDGAIPIITAPTSMAVAVLATTPMPAMAVRVVRLAAMALPMVTSQVTEVLLDHHLPQLIVSVLLRLARVLFLVIQPSIVVVMSAPQAIATAILAEPVPFPPVRHPRHPRHPLLAVASVAEAVVYAAPAVAAVAVVESARVVADKNLYFDSTTNYI